MNKFERMVRSLPSLYKPETNTIIGGLLKAWALEDDNIEVQISNTKDQLFIQTAGGRYLDFLGNNVGVPRDPKLGMGDDDFRNLIPVLSFYPKQVRKTIIALLDVFWGPGFTRANLNSGSFETYAFGPESLLTGVAIFTINSNKVTGNGTFFTLELNPGDYIKIATDSGYTYQKVSAIFSDTDLELAEAWKSPTGVNVQVAKGVIRELAYSVDSDGERTIRFKPYAFDDINAVTASELTKYINSDPEHNQYLTASVSLDPVLGTRLNLRTNTPGLLSAIQITGGDANAILNFDLTKHIDTKASVFEINPNEIVVRIPSSVPILRRNLKGATHPKQIKAQIFSNDDIFNFAGLGPTSTLTLNVDSTPYTVNFVNATDFAIPSMATATEVVNVINKQLIALHAFTEETGNFKKVGLRTTDGSMDYQITGGTANTVLGFVTTLQTDDDMVQANYPSSYVFDPIGQLFTVTGTTTTLNALIAQGSVTNAISVSNASSFPNTPGKLVFDFGRANQEGPVDYNGRPNNSTLLIDASHIFQKEHVVGRSVNLISAVPTIPRLTGADYPTFIVDTSDAAIAAQNLIKQLLAAGVVIRFIISYPEFLFECVCRDCGPVQDPELRGSRTLLPPLTF